MNKLFKIVLLALATIFISACEEKDEIYQISINTEISTNIHIENVDFDFKQFFIIKDSKGNNIEVLDSMIDTSNVDYTEVGRYLVIINFQGLSEELYINLYSETYTISINQELTTTLELGTETLDFKEYFIITDSNDNEIEVLDTMIDTSSVDFSKPGKFTITLTYKDQVQELEFNVITKYALDLFISEYAEGKNYDKYIEIFNGTGEDVDLSAYSLALYNHSKTPAQYTLPLDGVLKDGETLVVYNPSASSLIKDSGDLGDIVISFNGNDVIALYKDDTLIDVFGDLNNPVDSAWSVGDISLATKDHTLIRKSNVYGPNPTWTTSEWLVLDNEDFSNIKKHLMDNYQPKENEDVDPPKERVKDIFISEYFEGAGDFKDSKYIELYNPLGIDVDLSDYALAVYKEGKLEPDFIQPLAGTLKIEDVYIVYAPYSVDEIKAIGSLSSEVCYFNGKAAIALLKNNIVIDLIGVIGEYPVEGGWPVDDNSTTANNTIIRKETINSPTDEWDPDEWYPCYENYLYGLGNHDQIEKEDFLYEDFDAVFNLIKDLQLDNKGTATSDYQIKVKGTVYMDVESETTLVYITDGKNFIKLHGQKMHNYTNPGNVYVVLCYYKAYLYQPTLEVVDPANDIKISASSTPVSEIQVKEVTLAEILEMKKEDFVSNINNGYLQSMLKITGYLQIDTHNSNKYDYCLTVGEKYSKNDTGYIKNGLYFKNDVEELEEHLLDYEVVTGYENQEIDIFGVIYDWNPNRKNWRIYVDDVLTVDNLPE